VEALIDFVLSHLPPPPARVLEIGCGSGALALELSGRGYDVTAVDPEAPEGPIFRRVTIEAFDDPGPFDAVVASRSLHHMADPGTVLDKLRIILGAESVLVLEEFSPDRLDASTADWYEAQRRILAAAGREPSGPSVEEWTDHHADVHSYETMRRELDRHFAERYFVWRPYLYRYLEGFATEALERTLIDASAIQPLGWRYVGAPKRL
jgi:SAM-dependent methyltransferase